MAERATPADALAELRRERSFRERLYPRWIASDKLDQRAADRQMAALQAAIEIVEAAAATERLL